jgi:asparagine N-glycosylation enzyme membrane subunit Stt3
MNRYRQVIIAVAISAFGFSFANAQQQEKNPSSGEYAVSLTIQAVSRTVKAGSPVWVDVTETNKSDGIQVFFRHIPMDQGGNTYITDVWDSKGTRCAESTFYRKFQGHLTPEERREVMTVDKIPMSDGPVLLVKPGDTVKYQMDVGRLYDLSHPGTYTIQVQQPAQSNKITVTVTP